MKAFILAGGLGTRLRPITYAVPKPMIPYGEKPILLHIIESLKKAGIGEFILSVGYLSYQVKNYFGNGSKFGVDIKYAQEDKPLGTAGCLNLVRDDLSDTFMVIGGDNVTGMNFKKFIDFHKRKKSILTVALFKYREKTKWGIYELNEDESINTFVEKPSYEHLAGTMIFCCEPRILDFIPKRHAGVFNLTDHLIPELLKHNEKIYGFSFNESWIDIGSMEDYEKLINKK